MRRFWRANRPRFLWTLTSPIASPTLRFVERYGLVVRRGPFAGMMYPPASVGHVDFLAAKLIGSYEIELRPIVADLMRRRFRTLVNIGAGEGYYAVGFALVSPETDVHAFETSRSERALCRRLAGANGIAVHLSGMLTPSKLRRLELGPDTLLIVDIEGGELEILRPDIAPSLTHTTLLVELHPHIDQGIPAVITRRFEESHEVLLVSGAAREPAHYPEKPERILLSEGPPSLRLWGLFTPLDAGVAGRPRLEQSTSGTGATGSSPEGSSKNSEKRGLRKGGHGESNLA